MQRTVWQRAAVALVVCSLAVYAWPRSLVDARFTQVASRAVQSVTVTPTVSTPGGIVTIGAPAGTFPASAVAVINFKDGTDSYANIGVGKTPVGADGSLSATITLPQESAPGQALLFVTVNGVTQSTSLTIGPVVRLSAISGPAGSSVEVNGAGFESNSSFSFQIGSQTASVLGNELVTANLYGSFVALVLIPGNIPPGPVTISASDGVTSAGATFVVTSVFGAPIATATAPQLPTPTSTPVAGSAGQSTAYFAEGYTGRAATNRSATFSETLNMLNTLSTSVPVTITYFVQGTGMVVVNRTLPASSTTRESVNADVGSDRLVAASVEAGASITVSRSMARVSTTGQILDGSTTQATLAPALQWGFPEGYTGSTFQQYLTLLNPTGSQATVRIVLAPDASSPRNPQSLQIIVPPQSRATANIRALNAASTTKSVGMIVNSDTPIVAERVEYFGSGVGSAKFGSIVSGGIAQPATVLSAAFGASNPASGDQSFVTILNPAEQSTAISVTAMLANAAGQQVGDTRTLLIRPGTRKTIAVASLLHGAAISPFSVTLRATGPIDAEEAVYIGGSPNLGSHAGVAFALTPSGITGGSMSDLSTAGIDGKSLRRTLYLYNPGDAAVQIVANFFDGTGSTDQAVYAVSAHGISSVSLPDGPSKALLLGPLGARLDLAPGSSGAFIAWSVGLAAGGRSAIEDSATAAL